MSKIDKDSAESEYTRFLEAMDLAEKCERKYSDPEDQKSYLSTKDTVLTALMRGDLVVDPDGCPIFTPTKSEDRTPIKFREPNGSDIRAIDQVRKDREVEKTFAILASLTEQNRARFDAMVRRDQKVVEALLVLFLA